MNDITRSREIQFQFGCSKNFGHVFQVITDSQQDVRVVFGFVNGVKHPVGIYRNKYQFTMGTVCSFLGPIKPINNKNRANQLKLPSKKTLTGKLFHVGIILMNKVSDILAVCKQMKYGKQHYSWCSN